MNVESTLLMYLLTPHQAPAHKPRLANCFFSLFAFLHRPACRLMRPNHTDWFFGAAILLSEAACNSVRRSRFIHETDTSKGVGGLGQRPRAGRGNFFARGPFLPCLIWDKCKEINSVQFLRAAPVTEFASNDVSRNPYTDHRSPRAIPAKRQDATVRGSRKLGAGG
jgi:hypothetical protein